MNKPTFTRIAATIALVLALFILFGLLPPNPTLAIIVMLLAVAELI